MIIVGKWDILWVVPFLFFVPQVICELYQTGPKGVIADWRRFKQLETEKREEQERELVDLQKKLSLTCRSNVSF